MLNNLFSSEGILWKALNVLTDILVLSILFLIGCIPIITTGSSLTALYDSVAHCIRNKEPGPYRRFFNTYKSNIGITIGTTIIWAVIIFICYMILEYLREVSQYSSNAVVAAAAYYIVLLIPLGCAAWAFPIFSRFTYSFKDLNITAVKFALGFMPQTAVIVLLIIEVVQSCIKWYFPAFFMPAVAALLCSLFIEKTFAKYGGSLKKAEDDQ